MSTDTTVLVTAIGSMAAEAVISSLRQREGTRIIGCDINPPSWLPTSSLVDAFHQVPLASDANDYLEALLAIATREKVTHLFPLTDPEVDLLSLERGRFSAHATTVCLPSPPAVEVCRDKLALFERFQRDSAVGTIPTFRLSDHSRQPDTFPLLVKPRNGRSSEGLVRIANRLELSQLLARGEDSRLVVQPWLSGSIFAVDLVRDRDSRRTGVVAREELIRTSNGAGVTVRLHPDERLQAMAVRIAEALDIHGCINLEFLRHDGRYLLMDINPRFSAGVGFSIVAGYDMVLNHLACHSGGSIEPPAAYRSMIIAWRHTKMTVTEGPAP